MSGISAAYYPQRSYLQHHYDFSSTDSYPGTGLDATNLMYRIGNAGATIQTARLKNVVTFYGGRGGKNYIETSGYNSGAGNAVGDRIDINTYGSDGQQRFSSDDSFTFNFWIYPLANGRWFSTGSAGNGTGNDDQCIWQFYCTDQIFFWWDSSGGGTNNCSVPWPGGIFTLNQWQMFTVVFSSSVQNGTGNNTCTLYRNAETEPGSTWSMSYVQHSAIDRRPNTNMQYALGGGYFSSCFTANSQQRFGMYQLWNTSLTKKEVSELFAMTRSRYGIFS